MSEIEGTWNVLKDFLRILKNWLGKASKKSRKPSYKSLRQELAPKEQILLLQIYASENRTIQMTTDISDKIINRNVMLGKRGDLTNSCGFRLSYKPFISSEDTELVLSTKDSLMKLQNKGLLQYLNEHTEGDVYFLSFTPTDIGSGFARYLESRDPLASHQIAKEILFSAYQRNEPNFFGLILQDGRSIYFLANDEQQLYSCSANVGQIAINRLRELGFVQQCPALAEGLENILPNLTPTVPLTQPIKLYLSQGFIITDKGLEYCRKYYNTAPTKQ